MADPKFQNYLKYLEYFREREYIKFIRYPICLKMLEKLQDEQFVQ